MTTIASVFSPIGPVPDDWAVKPLQAVVRPLGRKNVGLAETNLLSLSYGSIVRKDIDALEGLLPESFEGYQIVEADDVVFRFTDLQNDQRSLRSGLAQERGIITSAYLAVRPTSINARYFAYLMRAYDQEKVFYSFGGGVRQSLKFDDVKRLPVPVPAMERQRRIAEFLDRETAQIDELIAKQEQLISTLAERLDSRWSELFVGLGREHGLTPVRRLIRSIVDGPFGSSLTSAHYVDEGHRVIRLGNLGIWAFKDNDKAFIDTEYAETLAAHAVRSGDVLVAGLGDEKMPLGRACVAPDGLGPAIVKADCYRVRPSHGVAPEYLAWALSAPPTRDQFQLLSRGTTRSRLNTTVVREARVPFPSVWEQERVTHEFKIMIADHERLAACAEGVKSLLAERRQALISAAVTGQIDVGGAS